MFKTKREAAIWSNRREQELGFAWDPPDFNILSLDELRTLPEVDASVTMSGVYFLWNIEERLVYIGQSTNISKRIAAHKTKPPASFRKARFMSIAHPWQLAIEQLYIDRYLPVMVLDKMPELKLIDSIPAAVP